MQRAALVCIIVLCFALLAPAANSKGHGEKGKAKTGILLVTFGTTHSQARQAFRNIESEVRKAFPGIPVRWAYTSRMIREKLAAEGERIDSPTAALAALRDDGFTRVAVQSLHTIPGLEYHDLLSVVEGFRSMHGPLRRIAVGSPLLAGPESLRTVRALLENIPEDREKDQAVLFMGHGTHHPSNAFYQAMAYLLQQEDPLAYMGTVEGSPSLQDILADLKAEDVETVHLMPFMSVAGDHARNDMAGEGKGSWRSVLKRAGFQVRTVMKGTAEFDNIVSVWIGHLRKAIAQWPDR